MSHHLRQHRRRHPRPDRGVPLVLTRKGDVLEGDGVRKAVAGHRISLSVTIYPSSPVPPPRRFLEQIFLVFRPKLAQPEPGGSVGLAVSTRVRSLLSRGDLAVAHIRSCSPPTQRNGLIEETSPSPLHSSVLVGIRWRLNHEAIKRALRQVRLRIYRRIHTQLSRFGRRVDARRIGVAVRTQLVFAFRLKRFGCRACVISAASCDAPTGGLAVMPARHAAAVRRILLPS